jgi:hypothetical protein
MNTEKREFLSLGSIIVLKGTTQKLMITARGVLVEDKGYYDYSGILYPEGDIMGGYNANFNQDQIFEVIHEGYSDADDKMMLEQLYEALEQYDAQQGEQQTSQKEVENPSDGIIHENKAEVVNDPFAAFAPDDDDD